MPHMNEWFYSQLLNLLKEKEAEREQGYYLPLQIETHDYSQSIPKTNIEDEIEKRGVIIINF